MTCDIAVSKHDMVTFVDQFQIGVAKLLDRFPEQTAPQPWTTGSSFFRANDGEMSVLGFDTTVAHIATEVTLFPGKG